MTAEPGQRSPSVPLECSFCERAARWVVEGDQHAFRARACAIHAHRALDLALYAGNQNTRVRLPENGHSVTLESGSE